MRISDWSSDVCSSDLREKAKWLPIRGDDWFFVANAVSDTVLEPRTFPIPVGVQTTERPGSLDVFGKDASVVFSQTFIGGVALIKGATAFKPPEIERSEERRVGNECVRTCRSRWSPCHSKQKNKQN